MDYGNLFNSLWNMAKNLIEIIGDVWNWLSAPLEINIPFLRDVPLVGGWFEWSLDYSPIELLGVGIITLVLLWIIKHLIPLG